MTAQTARAKSFLELHGGDTPLLVPNPWDVGTARLFVSLGFSALATTSGGTAFALGRDDYTVSRDDALRHCEALTSVVAVPVTADLENGFGDDPGDVAETVRLAVSAGLAGCSIEDYTRDSAAPIYPLDRAVERVAAAADPAHTGSDRLVLTARAENYFRGIQDLDDTIARLAAFVEVGADVVYAPGLVDSADIARVVDEVSAPVNVLAMPGGPTVPDLAGLGVARVSVGTAFTWVAANAVATAAREFLIDGTLGFWEQGIEGMTVVARALGS